VKSEINLVYNASSFEGSKSVVLSTAGAFGGKNSFLGITYIIVGCLCVLIAFLFYAKKRMSGGRFGSYVKDD